MSIWKSYSESVGFWPVFAASVSSAVLLISVRAVCQGIALPIEFSDQIGSGTLTIGFHSTGTEGFDSGLDVLAPPPPPSGAFDIRSIVGGEAFLTDFRDNGSTAKTFSIRYGLTAGSSSMLIRWDSLAVKTIGSLSITDDITGALFGPVDMSRTDRLDTGGSGGILSGGLRITALPASPTGLESRSVPTSTILSPPYPNPSAGQVHVRFHVQTAGQVTIALVTPLGSQITEMTRRFYRPGIHDVALDAEEAPGGVYVLVLRTQDAVFTRTVVIL